MGKHSPGPWKVIEQGIYTHVAHSDLGYRIANVFNQSSGGDFAKEETNSNAALIAASPELYRDLEIAANSIELLARLTEGEINTKAMQLVAAFNLTLKKARGES